MESRKTPWLKEVEEESCSPHGILEAESEG
jgi:hypothetical protein